MISWDSEDGVLKVFDNGEVVGTDTVLTSTMIPDGTQAIIGQAQEPFDDGSAASNIELSGFTMSYERVDDADIEAGKSVAEVSDDLAFDIQVVDGEIVDLVSDTAPNVTGDVSASNFYEFHPNENFNGEVELSYQVFDGTDAVDTTALLDLAPVNDAPESDAVTLSGDEDTDILITQEMLLANATDVDHDLDELTANNLSIDPQFGSLTDNEDGTWTFSPTENFNGNVPMTFDVTDGEATTSVDGSIDVAAINDLPDAPTVQLQGEEDQVLTIDPQYILDQVTDVDGDEISLENISVKNPPNATLTLQPDGMYHLVTAQDFNGVVELDYLVSDGEAEVEVLSMLM
ncbi:T1SS secreted agglutinin RTX [Vibrio sp. JCM 19236]|nr:T1SS secreted agglutinin RTX [Vibrio sp. JCM 19236]